MMRFYKIIFPCLLVLNILSCKEEIQTNKTLVSDTQIFQNVLDSIYSQHKNAVGLMVHIEAPDENISWSGAVGLSNKEKNTTLENDQPIWIASNTKTYVSATILRLVEDGKLRLDDTIDKFLSNRTNSLFTQDGYDTSAITIQHLLSHTSGIFDYASSDYYFTFVQENPAHRWTRNEQLELAISLGNPLSEAGTVFAYADCNYLLLTEIIEKITDVPFYEAMRELIDYKKQGMNSTWFISLEDRPENTKPFAKQYVRSMGIDTENVDPSFDLYGGGGIASTTKDLAVFCQHLFSNKIIKDQEILDLIYTKAKPIEAMESDYYLGISSVYFSGVRGYGHGGFWGTAVNYFPELNASIAVVVLDRDQRVLRGDLNIAMINILKSF
jgi:D-alanyl-D-alanine carboxypeptidase